MPSTINNVDLSYKDNATTITYDIESLPDLFSIVFIHDKAVTLLFYGDARYNHITDTQLAQTMYDYMSGRGKLDSFPTDSADELDYTVLRFTPEDLDNDRTRRSEFRKVMFSFVGCNPLPSDKQYHLGGDGDFVQYAGWNSSAYDLPLMQLIVLGLQSEKVVTPADIRVMSDALIGMSVPPWRMAEELEKSLKTRFSAVTKHNVKSYAGQSAWQDGHIDWAKIAKLTEDGGGENKFPPGLKKEMARFGFDIIEDDLVKGTTENPTDQQILDLVYYNVNDVLGTRVLGMNGKIEGLLKTRDIVRSIYPYTSARAVDFSDVAYKSPLERDCTAATLVGSVLTQSGSSKPVDNEEVSYMFPLPDGKDEDGNTIYRERDLLEFMREHEPFMHPDYYAFFDHFRGKDTRLSKDEHAVINSQPVTGKAQLNIPYYRDGKPTDSYIRVSTGGAHGSVCAGLSQMTDDEVSTWIRSDRGATDAQKPTIDLEHVHHLDWSSFYPVMASKLRLYETKDGVDRYTNIIERRFAIKRSLPADKGQWTDADREKNDVQTGLKFLLNNASGAGNTHNKYALLPVDNKTLSMRLIGNQMIWVLAQRCTQAGGFIIATNTDGIFVAGLTDEKIQQVVDDYVDLYGMPVDPEVEDRFINRDTSNRIEISNGTIQALGGKLRHGENLHFADGSVGNNVPYPLASAHAAVRYMVDDPKWLEKKYDRERMRGILETIRRESKDMAPWYHVHVGSAANRLVVDGERMAKINRLVLTAGDNAQKFWLEKKSEFTKAECRTVLHECGKGKSLSEVIESLGYTITDQSRDVNPADIRVCTKQSHPSSRTKVAVPLPDDGHPSESVVADESAFNGWWRGSTASTIGAPVTGDVDPDDPNQWLAIKVWKPGKMTGYPSNRGAVLNTTESLEGFNLDDLDMDAYLEWAESLLDTWKVTADIPDIGVSSHDDTVSVKKEGETKKSGKKQSRDKAEKLVTWLYDNSLSAD